MLTTSVPLFVGGTLPAQSRRAAAEQSQDKCRGNRKTHVHIQPGASFGVTATSIRNSAPGADLHPRSRAMQIETSLPGTVDYGDQVGAEPTGVRRAKQWSDDVETAYRFQVAGWRDVNDFLCSYPNEAFDIWPSGWPKKLPIKDAQKKIQADRAWYYFSQSRECEHKHVHKVKIYDYN